MEDRERKHRYDIDCECFDCRLMKRSKETFILRKSGAFSSYRGKGRSHDSGENIIRRDKAPKLKRKKSKFPERRKKEREQLEDGETNPA